MQKSTIFGMILGFCTSILLANSVGAGQTSRERFQSSDQAGGAAAPGLKQKTIATRSQMRNSLRQQTNSGLVTIIFGASEDTDSFVTSELVSGLERSNSLRVLQVRGNGAVQNVTDLMFARGIDVGIVRSDVLDFIRRKPLFPGIGYYLQYITKLYDEEVHILAARNIHSIEDLAGKKVNFGTAESDNSITASLVFGNMGVKVDSTDFSHALALEKLRQGDISALVYVSAKPADVFQMVKADDNLHFISIPATGDMRGVYTPTTIRAEDYPELIEEGKPIQTIAAGLVLAVYSWPQGTDRYRSAAHFARSVLDRFQQLKSPLHHPKWREIDFETSVPGWTRFAPAQEWVDKAVRDREEQTRYARIHATAPEHRLQPESSEGASAGGPSPYPAELNRLFADFLEYQKGQTTSDEIPRESAKSGKLIIQSSVPENQKTSDQINALFAAFMEYQERETAKLGAP